MLKATGNHVIVEQTKVVKKTGLTELDKLGFDVQHGDEGMAQNAVQYGVVISIGPCAWEAYGPNFTGKPWVEQGDTVFFPRYAGAKIEDPEEPGEKRHFVLLNEDDIQIIIEEGVNPTFPMKEYKFHTATES